MLSQIRMKDMGPEPITPAPLAGVPPVPRKKIVAHAPILQHSQGAFLQRREYPLEGIRDYTHDETIEQRHPLPVPAPARMRPRE